MMNYKGYIGEARIDAEAEVIRGRVINTRDMITFQGRTVAEARQAFRDSVDDYLEFCVERREEPEKPFSGRFVVRIKPTVHQALARAASREGTSLNAVVSRALTRAARKMGVPSSPSVAVGKSKAAGKSKAKGEQTAAARKEVEDANATSKVSG